MTTDGANCRHRVQGPNTPLRNRSKSPCLAADRLSFSTRVTLSLVDCHLKAVALKASIWPMCPCETDAQRPIARHSGEEHATASGCARSKSGSACARERAQPDVSQRGGTFRTKCLNRQHRSDCQRAWHRTLETTEERLSWVAACRPVRSLCISPDRSSRFLVLFPHIRPNLPELDLHVVVWLEIAVADLCDFRVH
jgi:hypothetical protein